MNSTYSQAEANKALDEIITLNEIKLSIREINAETLLEAEKFKKRIEDLENKIAKSAETSFNYSLNNQSRFAKGEEIIKKSPNYAYKYSKQILNQRWEEAESTILESIKYSYLYSKNVLGKRWDILEQKIIKKETFKDDEYFSKYIIKYIDAHYKERFYEMEEALAEKLSIKKLFEYWQYYVPAGRLSETAHNRIVASALSNDGYAKDYVNLLTEQNSRFLSYLKSLNFSKDTTIQELIDYVSTTSIQQNIVCNSK